MVIPPFFYSNLVKMMLLIFIWVCSQHIPTGPTSVPFCHSVVLNSPSSSPSKRVNRVPMSRHTGCQPNTKTTSDRKLSPELQLPSE